MDQSGPPNLSKNAELKISVRNSAARISKKFNYHWEVDHGLSHEFNTKRLHIRTPTSTNGKIKTVFRIKLDYNWTKVWYRVFLCENLERQRFTKIIRPSNSARMLVRTSALTYNFGISVISVQTLQWPAPARRKLAEDHGLSLPPCTRSDKQKSQQLCILLITIT